MSFNIDEFAKSLAAAKPGATPYWRWDRGRLLVKRRRLMKRREDSWTMRAREFHRSRAGLAKRNGGDHTVDAAFRIFHEDREARWLMEANILACVPTAGIAQKLSLREEVVIGYTALFFDVRDSLDATGWILIHALGADFRTRDFFEPKTRARLLREFGYFLGEHVLDVAVSLFNGIAQSRFTEEELDAVEVLIGVEQLPVHPAKPLLQLTARLLAEPGTHPSVFHIPQEAKAGTPPSLHSCAKRVVAHRGIDHVRRTVPHSPVRVRGAGWERRGKAFYYYRMTRIGGKPRRVYVGSGRLGRLHELLDRKDERARLAVRAARDREQKQLAEADHLRVEVLHFARLIFDAQMVATGHYLHGGQWRRVLGRPKTRQYRREEREIEESTGDLPSRLKAITRRANDGDFAALAELRELLNHDSAVWGQMDRLCQSALACWSNLAAERTGTPVETLSQIVSAFRVGLLGDEPIPAERALGEAAIVARMALTYAEETDVDGGQKERRSIRRLRSAKNCLSTALKHFRRVQSVKRAISPKAIRGRLLVDLPNLQRIAG